MAVFTTRERVDMPVSFRFETAFGTLEPFSEDRIYLDVYESLRHRADAVSEARAITHTIIASIQARKRLLISREDLLTIASKVIQRYDRSAYVRFVSMHR
jgi:transcriptional regulator NrdR family protein